MMKLCLIVLIYFLVKCLCDEAFEGGVNSNATSAESNAADWEKHQRIQANQEARRRRKSKEREKENIMIAKRTLQASIDESCDWKSQPLAFLQGAVCGSYYKILGLDRKRGIIDKADIKKAYRNKSLNVHPDKNSSPEANEAFKLVQDAYECLSDDSCRSSYDRQLNEAEVGITLFREEVKRQLIEKGLSFVSHAHYYLSVAAHHIYQTGLDLWDLAGEVEVNIFGQNRPIGKAIMFLTLMLRGKTLLAVHSMAYVIVRLNYELAKSRGLF